MALKVGSKVNGKYEILKVINSGGMSTVYIAMDLRLNKNWAIKEIIKSKSKMGGIEYKSLVTETNILKELDHVYLPRIVDVIEDDVRIFVVMDYIEGKTLLDVVLAEGGLPQSKVIKWGRQLATVLGYLHGRDVPIIYRDMKPGNIMLQPNGDIKLFDFGASRVFKGEESWKTQPLGTKGYAAPERYGGKFDVRSDIYELGMTLYHLLTGHDPSRTPEQVKKITDWRPNLSKGLENVILKMTATHPDDRYQSTSELLYDLSNYESLDIDFKKKLINKLKVTLIAGITTVALFTLSGVSYYANGVSINNNYEKKLEEARATNNPSLAVEASYTKRGDLGAFNLLVELYQKDDKFTEVEEVQLTSAISLSMEELKKLNRFGAFALEVANLYYYYGKDLTTPNDKAINWINDALTRNPDNKDELQNKKLLIELSTKLTEGFDEETFINYWNALVEEVEYRRGSGYVQLQNVKTLFTMVEKDMGNIKKAGLQQTDLLDMLTITTGRVTSIRPVTDTEKALQKELTDKTKPVLDKVNNSFK